jgi:septin family protein
MYYLYGKDIYKFDPVLSQMLYEYYFHELRIEQDRKFLYENYRDKDLSSLDKYNKEIVYSLKNDSYSRMVLIKDLTPLVRQNLTKYQ